MSQLDPQILNQLYSWIDEASLSRPKRNISRDFSDGVLMAQLIGNHYPKQVDKHNYPTSSSLQAKINNWNILNKKVLSKLDLQVSPSQINDIASSKPLAIQRVLIRLKQRIQSLQRNAPHQHGQNDEQDQDRNFKSIGAQLSKVDQLKLIYRLLTQKIQSVQKNIKRKDQHIQQLQNIINAHKR